MPLINKLVVPNLVCVVLACAVPIVSMLSLEAALKIAALVKLSSNDGFLVSLTGGAVGGAVGNTALPFMYSNPAI